MAYLIKLTANVMLVEPSATLRLLNDRPYVVHNAKFVRSCITRKQIRVIDGEVSDKATDKEFEKTWREFSESNTQERSAIANFLSIYGTPIDYDKAPEEIPGSKEVTLPVSGEAKEEEHTGEAPNPNIPEGHKICERCGTVYKPKNGVQKYCHGPLCKKK